MQKELVFYRFTNSRIETFLGQRPFGIASFGIFTIGDELNIDTRGIS